MRIDQISKDTIILYTQSPSEIDEHIIERKTGYILLHELQHQQPFVHSNYHCIFICKCDTVINGIQELIPDIVRLEVLPLYFITIVDRMEFIIQHLIEQLRADFILLLFMTMIVKSKGTIGVISRVIEMCFIRQIGSKLQNMATDQVLNDIADYCSRDIKPNIIFCRISRFMITHNVSDIMLHDRIISEQHSTVFGFLHGLNCQLIRIYPI